MNDSFTEQDKQSGKSGKGCVVMTLAALVLLGLIMWMILWGRAMPKPDAPIPTTANESPN